MRSTIILSDDEIRGLLDGSRTQLRRPVVPPKGYPYPEEFDIYAKVSRVSGGLVESSGEYDIDLACPFGAPGARLSVREAWAEVHPLQVAEGRYSQEGRAGIPGPPAVNYRTIYRADGDYPPVCCLGGEPWPYRSLEPFERDGIQAFVDEPYWLPSISMPRWACRYALEVGEVRCQRLHDAAEDDAIAEGCRGDWVDRGITVGWEVSSAVEELAHRWGSRYGKRYPWESNPWTFVSTGRLVAL